MRYASVCSGIEAATVAWKPLGCEAAWFSEIEPFPCAVLAHHYPDVPNLGDMTRITEAQIEEHGRFDLLVGGTPCQSFSVAGLRKGLADPRGNLALDFLRLADAARPRWLVWENVPGVLSSNGGRDFGSFLGALVKLGYGFAYRVLDAQYVRVESHARAVPQRRRRVFVVGHLGDWRRAAAVLFERESMSGHPPPRREAGAGVAASLTRGADSSGKGGYAGRRREDDVNLVAGTVQANYADKWGLDNQHIDAGGPNFVTAFDTTQITSSGNYSNPKPGDACHPLAEGAHPPAVAFNWQAGGSKAFVGGTRTRADALHANQIPALQHGLTVRRLTPLECERLQGFPDHYTAVEYRGKPAKDGPRYKGLGNTIARNVIEWIGRRIDSVEATATETERAGHE